MKRTLKRGHWFCLVILASPLFCPADEPTVPPPSTPDSAAFSKSVQPFFARNCYACHNSKLKTSGLNLEAFDRAAAVMQNREESEKILQKLRAGEMPPKGLPRPNEADLKLVTNWLEQEFDRADRQAKPDPARVSARRLNRAEYNNTVRDLLGVDVQPADDFPQDDSAFGFDNVAQALSVSPLLMEKYLATAEKIARAAVYGPDLKNLTTAFLPPIPRRMETTNLDRIEKPAYYSLNDYDVTGLSQPGSFHLTYRFPADGEYLIRVAGAGFRPEGSEPGQFAIWLDGKLVQTFEVNDAESSGFERRPDHWDVRLRITAGPHEIVAAFPKQFEGLPANYGGPNPSRKPVPPRKDPLLSIPPLLPEEENIPERVERRRQTIERAKLAASRPPVFEGMCVHEVDIVGPYEYQKAPSPESLRRVYACGHLDGAHQPGCERKILSSLARRAFRRPVSSEEMDGLVAIFSGARKRGGSFEEGISVGLETILVSPDFLFRIEKASDAPGAAAQIGRAAGLYELASRLSYFLWSSMPDDELLRAAEMGALRQPAVLAAQVRRMLADAKSRALVENFAGQWLETRRLESVQPDRERFPDFDEYLRASMMKETELFFQHVMQEDRSVLDFIDGPYTFLNERLARHYGIRGVTGTEFRRVDLAGTGRSGILTQASVLAVSSYSNRTSPVLRGKWILENILNAPPPPPPANVPSLDEDAVGSSASLRQQMEQHRKNAVCASCHARMDPLGFGLENFDAVGAWRREDGKFLIDSSGALPDGRTFQGAEGLETILRQQKDAFAECLAEKMLTYALGRGVERSDRPALRQIVARMAGQNYRFSSLVLGIVESAPFQIQREQPASQAAPTRVAQRGMAGRGAAAK